MPRLTNAQAKALKFDFTKTCPACQRVLDVQEYANLGERERYVFTIRCKPCGHEWTEYKQYARTS